jgi:D-threo-aldose 1-dehydrogenase
MTSSALDTDLSSSDPRGRRLGFGGAPLGNMFEAIDDQTADDTLAAAWETGARHFDTAPVYGNGLGELRFGHFLRRQPRDQFEVSTKVGRLLKAPFTPVRTALATAHGPGVGETSIFESALPFRVDVDYGYDAAMRSIEDSMARMGLGYIDIVYVHDLGSDHLGDEWEDQFAIAEDGAFRALRELRDQGVIGAWGLGNNVIAPQLLAIERADPDVLHISGRYTLLDQSAIDELLPRALEHDIPVILGGPYNSGILTGGHRFDYRAASPQRLAVRDRIAYLCARHGVDLGAAALQFCAAHPAVSAVIPGTKHPNRARENARRFVADIPAQLWADIKDEEIIRPDAPVPA